MYYVYVLKSKVDLNTYIGYSGDLKARLENHNKGKNKSTKHRAPFELIYYEAYKNETDARRREQELKNNNYQKEQLIKRISNSLI
jgi:putative endonuclease